MRDALLGREPKDFDVATDATPDRVREIFGKRKTLAFGASFGVIAVLPEGRATPKIGPTEVATFRSDGEYSDGRRPDKVHYGDARNDALRRDFTINGLFFDPAAEKVIDFVGGQADLSAGRLRTIGEARERFDEDKLRMLRAVRFATTLGFQLESSTQKEIIAHADEISVVSAERIGAEMRRMVISVFAPRGLQLLVDCGLDRLIMPQLKLADRQRLIDLLGHRETLRFESSMALILLTVADNPNAAPIDQQIKQMRELWRLSGEEVRQISSAVSLWKTVAGADELAWSRVQPVLMDRDIECILDVATTIINADGGDGAGVSLCREALRRPKEELDPEPLITGESLREAGHQPGPNFRRWLQAVRDAQLDGTISTEAEAFDLISRL